MKIRFFSFLFTLMLPFLAVNAQFNYIWDQVRMGGSGFVPNIYSHPKVKDLHFITTDVGSPYRWNASLSKWEPIMMFNAIPSNYWTWEYSARCGEIALDPNDATGNILYATMATGMDPANPAGSGRRHNYATVMKSTDRGNTWQDLNLSFFLDPNSSSKTFNNRIVVDPSNSDIIWLATDINGTLKSVDGGATWNKVNTGYPDVVTFSGTSQQTWGVRFLLFDKSDGTITNAEGKTATKAMYMGTLDGLFKSNDAGATFTKVPGVIHMLRRGTIHADGTIYVTYMYTENGANRSGVQRYTKAGAVTDITPEPGKEYAQVAVNPANSNEVVTGSRGTWNKDAVYRSTNGGNPGTWTKLATTRDISEAPHLGNSGVGSGNIANNPIQFSWDPFYATKVWVVDMSGVVVTNNIMAATTDWKLTVKGLEEIITTGKLVAPTSGRNELLVTTADVGGADFANVQQTPTTPINLQVSIWSGFNGQSAAYQENNPNFMVRISTDSWGDMGQDKDRSGYSTDGGLTYTRFPNANVPGLRGRVHITNNGRIIWMTQSSFVGSSLGGVFYSDDKGTTWTESAGAPRGTLSYGGIFNINSGEDKLAVDKVNPNKVYLYDRLGAFYTSNDGGASFTKSPAANLPKIYTWGNGSCYTTSTNLITIPGREGEIWFGYDKEYAEAGIYYSKDGGQSFTFMNRDKVPVPRYFAAALSDNTPDAHLVLYSATSANTEKGTAGFTRNKIYRSDDLGKTWTEIASPVPGLFTTFTAGMNGRLYASVSGNGVWFAEQGGPVESVKIETATGLDSVVIGNTLKLRPKFQPNSPTNKNVTWSSSDPAVAEINQEGLLTGKTVGTATITVVTEDGGKTDSKLIYVNPIVKSSAIVADSVVYITPRGNKSISVKVLPENTTDKELVWTSADPDALIVDQNGNIQAIKKQTTLLTVATKDGGASATIKVVVNNLVRAFNAGSDPRNGGGNGTFKDSVIGQFLPEGPDGAAAPGVNNWHCYSLNRVFLTQAIDVSATVNPAPVDVYRSMRRYSYNTGCKLNYYFRNLMAGAEYTLRLHFMEDEFTSNGKRNFNVFSNGRMDSIKNMDIFKEAGGRWKPFTRTMKAKADNNGLVSFYFETPSGTTATISAVELLMQEVDGIEFLEAPESLSVGTTAQFSVKFTPSNATNKGILWSSSAPSIISVNPQGKITALAEGKATITAIAADGGFTLNKEVTSLKIPLESVTLQPSDTTVYAGEHFSARTTFTPANATIKDVKWTSSNDSLVSVTGAGVVTAKAKGTATITATSVDNPSVVATMTVNVKNVTIQGLTLTAPSATVGVGSTLSMQATITPMNATPKQLIWKSSDSAVATVDAHGVVKAVGVGNVTITATTQDEVVITKAVDIQVVEMGVCGALSNNGFESDFLHWNIMPGAESNISITTTAANVDNGYRAAMFGIGAAESTFTSDPIAVSGGVAMSIQTRLWIERVSNQAPSWAGALVTFYDASDNVLTTRRFSAAVISGVYDGYVTQNLNVTSPDGTVKMTLSYSKTGSGKFYVDNACVTLSTGLWGNYANPYGMKVAPNPVKNSANISLTLNEFSNMRFRIYRLTGAVVDEKTATMSAGENAITFDTSGLAAGVYNVEALNVKNQSRSIVKIVK